MSSPEGWRELQSRQDWEEVRKSGGFIVITDDVNAGPIFHHRGCRSVTLAGFTEKVLYAAEHGRRPNGKYFWVESQKVARDGGARACKIPNDPMYL